MSTTWPFNAAYARRVSGTLALAAATTPAAIAGHAPSADAARPRAMTCCPKMMALGMGGAANGVKHARTFGLRGWPWYNSATLLPP